MRYKLYNKGIALISVLWVVTILSLLATSLVASQRTESETTRILLQQAQARLSAEAAVHFTLYQLLNKKIHPGGDSPEALENFRLAGNEVEIELSSEAGKVNINRMQEAVLLKIIASIVPDEQQAMALTAAILDWRDGDDLVRPNGAEKRDYQQAGMAYMPSNRPFRSIEELQRVLGMTPATYLQLEPLVTLYSNQSNIDLAAASPTMLKALGREPNSQQRQFLSAGSSRILAVNTITSRNDQPVIQLNTTVLLNPGASKAPFSYLSWKFVPPGISEQVQQPFSEEDSSEEVSSSNLINTTLFSSRLFSSRLFFSRQGGSDATL